MPVTRPLARLVAPGALPCGAPIARSGLPSPSRSPSGAIVAEYPNAILCPGLIDCATSLGVLGELSERQTAVQAQVRAADAFNRFSPQLLAALAAGVTTFALVPDEARPYFRDLSDLVQETRENIHIMEDQLTNILQAALATLWNRMNIPAVKWANANPGGTTYNWAIMKDSNSRNS